MDSIKLGNVTIHWIKDQEELKHDDLTSLLEAYKANPKAILTTCYDRYNGVWSVLFTGPIKDVEAAVFNLKHC